MISTPWDDRIVTGAPTIIPVMVIPVEVVPVREVPVPLVPPVDVEPVNTYVVTGMLASTIHEPERTVPELSTNVLSKRRKTKFPVPETIGLAFAAITSGVVDRSDRVVSAY